MKRYFIEDAKFGMTAGGMGCGPIEGCIVATVQFKDKDKTKWLCLSEFTGIPNFYLFDKDYHDEVVKDDFDNKEYTDYMSKHAIEEFNGLELDGEYEDILDGFDEDPKNPAIPLIKYLIAVVQCDTDEVDGLLASAKGKYADELTIPDIDIDDDLFDYSYEDEEELPEDLDKESLYRMRLALEADIETESVFRDMDDSIDKSEKKTLNAIKERCEDEKDYEDWKRDYLASEYEKVKGSKYLVCSYVFAGIGQYETVIPEEQKESFITWINSNGSAFFTGERDATREEVERYLALQADAGLN